MPARLDSYSGAYNSEVQISTASIWGSSDWSVEGWYR